MARKRRRKLGLIFQFLGLLVILSVFFLSYQMGWIEFPLETAPEPAFTGAEEVKAVYFCPDQNCEQALVQEIDSAQASLHCALYDIDLASVEQAFLAAQERGLEVKIVSDDKQSKREKSVVPSLMEKGLVKLDAKEGDYMHNKFCIFDGKKVWLGSFNTTYNGANRNNNNAVLIESELLASNFAAELEEMWQGNFGSQSPKNTVQAEDSAFEVYFCPEDGCAAAIEKFINNSSQTIDCMFFSFTLDELGDAFVSAKEKGLSIRMIFESKQISQYSEFEKLQKAGLNVIKDNNPFNMHNKLCIFDNEIVLTGSMNPSKHSEYANDESILFIKDREVAGIYTEYFNKYWQQWS